jgi:hypothetical protein
VVVEKILSYINYSAATFAAAIFAQSVQRSILNKGWLIKLNN